MTVHRSAKVIVLLGLAAAAWGGFCLGQEATAEFRGRIFMGGGPNRPGALTTRIIVSGYTDLNDIQKLAVPLNAGDVEGFFSVFRQMKKGEMRFVGGAGLQINFNAAQERQTDKGIKIFLVGDSRSIESGVAKRVAGSALFLVVELDLNAKYEGEGKIYEDARISFTADGMIKLDSYLTTPKLIVNVRKSK
ncbi:MAG: hypothetical protein FJY82_15370 [Candidatus Aminicenantes bacterium]|nr:hypothetical protein [Candidatus Aminicenantes bacterium]